MPERRRRFELFAGVALAVGLAAAGAARGAPQGTKGLVGVPFAAANGGPGPIGCGIAAAHWYSVDLGTAASGDSVRAVLWADPATGAVFVLNQNGDRLPVESLWCGLAGRTWATRSTVGLERLRGVTPAAIALACRSVADRLECRQRTEE